MFSSNACRKRLHAHLILIHSTHIPIRDFQNYCTVRNYLHSIAAISIFRDGKPIFVFASPNTFLVTFPYSYHDSAL
ncbi:hypothetical protein Bhyg_05081 [Pseudolycoriella hygida]|uniref:Uncharacterized protein n=1 Tax=Pseudolycoriella hygida TaxID=35572 RepID=A0A9Q0SAI7_9DIPT|nr:hypothetical protein Bhyg_05081 [Pseudolycoriella hygida]